MNREALIEKAKTLLGAEGEACPERGRRGDRLAILVRAEGAHRLLEVLKNDPDSPFEMLVDLTAVDYLDFPKETPERFAVIYQLYSFTADVRLRVKAFVPEAEPEIDTATDLWPAAGWLEREAQEMFGIIFRGHPDPRKLLMPESYEGFPLRRDYPLEGRGEREDFVKYTEIPEE